MNNQLHKKVGPFRAVLLVIVAGVVVTALVSGAFASSSQVSQPLPAPTEKAYFSVFSKGLHRTKPRIASVEPAEATLAAINSSGGVAKEIYVRKETTGEYCIIEVEGTTTTGGVACAKPETAEAEGVDLQLRGGESAPVSVTLLVPDGVTSATYAKSNGAEETVATENNVVTLTDPSIISVHYTMPDGLVKVVQVPTASEARERREASNPGR